MFADVGCAIICPVIVARPRAAYLADRRPARRSFAFHDHRSVSGLAWREEDRVDLRGAIEIIWGVAIMFNYQIASARTFHRLSS
jgi:hypothetical protein